MDLRRNKKESLKEPQRKRTNNKFVRLNFYRVLHKNAFLKSKPHIQGNNYFNIQFSSFLHRVIPLYRGLNNFYIINVYLTTNKLVNTTN